MASRLFPSWAPDRRAHATPNETVRRRKVRLTALRAAGLCVLVLAGVGVGRAQETFAGGDAPTTYTDQSSGTCIQNEPPNVFKQMGISPMVCHPEEGPQDSNKQCSYAGMTMVARIGETCYYCVAIVPPINGIIVPEDQARNAGNQGYSCVGDPFDPDCMIICEKPGKLTYTPPGPNGDVPAPRQTGGGPPAGGGAPMPGPAGGIGYVGGANPCLPMGPGGYDYCSNGPGARLPAGCSCSKTPVPGNKSVTRVPGPEQPAPGEGAPKATPPSVTVIYQTMNACLREKVPYMVIFLPQAPYMNAAMVAAEGSVKASTPLNQVPFRSQLFILETAAALQAQAYHDSLYGPSTVTPNAQDQKDTLVGWLDRCLADAGIAPTSQDAGPNNPINAYGAFLGAGSTQSRVRNFGTGYGTEMIEPASLLPPRTAQ